MAISDFAPGTEVWILDGNGHRFEEIIDPNPAPRAPVHDDKKISDYQNAHTVTRYIVVRDNEQFSINIGIGEPIRTPLPGNRCMICSKIGFVIIIDGHDIGFCEKCERPFFKNNPEVKEWRTNVEGIKAGKGKKCEINKFKFMKFAIGDLNLDRRELERLKRNLKKVGKIVVKMEGQGYGKKGSNARDVRGDLMDDNKIIDERALKGEAKDLGTGLRPAEKAKPSQNWKGAEPINGKDYPMVIFEFIYGSEEALKQLHLMARTPSPSPTPMEDPDEIPDDDSQYAPKDDPQNRSGDLLRQLSQLPPDEQASLLAQLARENARSNSASASASSSGRGDRVISGRVEKKPRFKKERPESNILRGMARSGQTPMKNHETIDLTDDGFDEQETAAAVETSLFVD